MSLPVTSRSHPYTDALLTGATLTGQAEAATAPLKLGVAKYDQQISILRDPVAAKSKYRAREIIEWAPKVCHWEYDISTGQRNREWPLNGIYCL